MNKTLAIIVTSSLISALYTSTWWAFSIWEKVPFLTFGLIGGIILIALVISELILSLINKGEQ